ncbi:MAG: hypothetical protein ACI89X_000717 [Planctomycetota bacterium]|jgi:hypothetical protein
MEELVHKSMPFVGPAMLPILVMLLAPLLRTRGRTILAVLMALPVVGLLGDVLFFDHSHILTLDVPSVFGRGPEHKPHVWTIESITVPAWHWHVVAAAYYALAALFAFVGRNRDPKVPHPVAAAVLMFVIVIVTRMALEKTAGHVGIVWALGTSGAGIVISLFFGYFAGARGMSFGKFFTALVLANVLQRAFLTAVGYFMTTQHLGTHLDVTVVTEISLPGMGDVQLESPTHGWMIGILMPQMTFILVTSVVVGLVLGLVPFWFGKRRVSKS